MHGMIHQAARELCLEVVGARGWEELLDSVGLRNDFRAAESYPDEQTFSLVAAIADKVQLSLEDTLRAFGRYWIRYADKSAHGAIMGMSGSSMAEFLGNLDQMHASIQRAMPDTTMPSFRLLDASSEALEVEYISKREGLEPFVLGLLEGLMDRFREPGMASWRAEGERRLFSVRFAAARPDAA